MLKDKLYYIQSCTAGNDGCRFDISLEPDSVIYKAHFPGRPITPGVCLMQMAVELLNLHLGCEYKLCGARNVKFTVPVVPEKGKSHTFTFSSIGHDDKGVSARVLVMSADVIHAKMILSLIP